MNYVLPPSSIASLAVKGSSERFPVRRVYCVGRNYVEHAQEMGFTGREPPFFFMKPADAVVSVEPGRVASIAYPSLTQNLHHEVELVVAIGKAGRNIPASAATHYIWGYAVGLDMTRRDLQNEAKKQGRPWEIGKAFEQSAPIGPITPKFGERVLAEGAIELEVNGRKVQSSDIGKLIWSIPEIIEHLSAAWTLAPGDLIMTGTPEGVGPVVAGDKLLARCEGCESIEILIV